ncbi:MAG: GDP-L-fucose synthase [Bacteroidetes bacterium]|nr:GDP-L-fucose synthase [Bacteroidota bacterium]
MQLNSKIFIAGYRGMVGSAISRLLRKQGYSSLLERTSAELDLRNQQHTERFFNENKPDYVFLAAAKVGGILANKNFPADFLYDNIMIESNVISAAYKYSVKKLLFLGSSCIYPKFAKQPIKEEYLLTGELEPTNDAYAIAKIAGIKLCQAYYDQFGKNFISVMPTNLYGIGDNYHPEHSHVLPALIRKVHEAKINNNKSVIIWGTGKPLREFLFADDLADACLFLMKNYNEREIINIGSGQEYSITDLAEIVKSIVGFKGEIIYDLTKPDGTPRKLLDSSRLNGLGWNPSTELKEGIKLAYADFLKNVKL